jgi:hypothetical protein
MRTHQFPTSFRYWTTEYKENEIGFYDVDVEVPDMYIPPLGMRYEGMDGKLIFPTGSFRGIWSTIELNYAMSLGVKIKKIYRGAIFNNGGFIFKEYIDTLYDMRKKSKKDSVDNVLCKLLMNSTYGRFGLNLLREQLVFDYGQLGVSPFAEIPLGGGKMIRLDKKEVTLDSSFANVAISAWVTSGARVWMHKLYLVSPESLYYTDTDSIKSTHKYNQNDNDLGELKLEYKSRRACFILPKTYFEDTTDPIFKLFDGEGRELKIKNEEGLYEKIKTNKKIVMKGFDSKKIKHFSFEDFTSCLEGDMIRLRAKNPKKFATLRTAVKKNEFLYLLSGQERQIRTRYNKRRIYKRAWAQVYDTEPLHIKNGFITNLDDENMKKWKAPDLENMVEIGHKVLRGE